MLQEVDCICVATKIWRFFQKTLLQSLLLNCLQVLVTNSKLGLNPIKIFVFYLKGPSKLSIKFYFMDTMRSDCIIRTYENWFRSRKTVLYLLQTVCSKFGSKHLTGGGQTLLSYSNWRITTAALWTNFWLFIDLLLKEIIKPLEDSVKF